MDKILEESLLYDFYSELLTERQKSVYENVRFGDLSLSEAAEAFGISRQGVHDMLRRTDAALRGYESKLGLVKRFMEIRRLTGKIRSLCAELTALDEGNCAAVSADLEELNRLTGELVRTETAEED